MWPRALYSHDEADMENFRKLAILEKLAASPSNMPLSKSRAKAANKAASRFVKGHSPAGAAAGYAARKAKGAAGEAWKMYKGNLNDRRRRFQASLAAKSNPKTPASAAYSAYAKANRNSSRQIVGDARALANDVAGSFTRPSAKPSMSLGSRVTAKVKKDMPGLKKSLMASLRRGDTTPAPERYRKYK